jgi:hypothetical protein
MQAGESNEHLYQLQIVVNEHSVTATGLTGPHVLTLPDLQSFQTVEVQTISTNPLKLKLVLKKPEGST